MHTLLVQRELRHGKSPADIAQQYNLEFKETEDLALFNYTSGTKSDCPCNTECRGAIIEKLTGNLKAAAFIRFWNIGEPRAAQIDWDSAWATEKIDGSLVSVFYHKGRWRIATRGELDAVGGFPVSGGPYARFCDAIKDLIDPFIDKLDVMKTYYFEFVSPWNRVVTRYGEMALYLLTVRDENFDEFSLIKCDEIAVALGVRRPRRLICESLNDVEAAISALRADEEGFVVVDKKFNRVKIKKPSYLVMFKLLNNNNSSSSYVNLILKNEDEEFISYFPEYKQAIEARRKLVVDFLNALDDAWRKYGDLPDKKAFALAVKDINCNYLLFQMWDRKDKFKTVADLFASFSFDAKKRIIMQLL
jgi:hypothetical protein